jgi:CRP-like cAMP-binding protein
MKKSNTPADEILPSMLDQVLSDKSISQNEIESLRNRITIKHATKGTVLVHKGDLDIKTYFVQKGCLRSYATDEKGKEHIFMFAPEGWIMSDIEANTNHSPSELFIDVLEDSVLEVFDRELFTALAQMPVSQSLLTQERLMRRISVLQKRIIMLMSASAMERYQSFIKTYPNIVQRVPQKMIASYLGITPEALSRIRGEIAKPKNKTR